MKSFRLYRSFRILAVLAFLVLLGSCESPKPAVPAGPPAPKASKPEVVELPDFAQTGFRFVPQTGHTQGITKLAWHPSGEFFATSSSDKTVKIWNVDGTVVQDLQFPKLTWGVSFSPDGKCLAVACWDNNVYFWYADGRPGKKITNAHTKYLYNVQWSPDGERLLSCGDDGRICLIDKNLTSMKTIYLPDARDVAWLPGGKTFGAVTSGYPAVINIYDLEGNVIRTNKFSEKLINLAFSPAGQLATTGQGGSDIWSVEPVKPKHYLNMKTKEYCSALTWSPDGKTILTGYEKLFLFSSDGKELKQVPITIKYVADAAWSPDGKTFLAGEGGDLKDFGVVKLYSKDGAVLREYKGKTHPVFSVQASPDGNLVVQGLGSGKILVWRRDAAFLRQIDVHASSIRRIVFTPDGDRFFTASADGTARCFRAADGKLLFTCPHGNEVNDLALRSDGKVFVTACSDRQARVFNADTGALMKSVIASNDQLRHISYDLDETRVIVKDLMGNNSWFRPDEAKPKVTSGGSTPGERSPDGKYFAFWNYGSALMEKGKNAVNLPGVSGSSYSWSRSSSYLVLSGDKEVSVLDVSKHGIAKKLNGHSAYVYGAAFLDEDHLVSASQDSTLVFWNWKKETRLTALSDGRDWIVYTEDGLWDASPRGGSLVAMSKGLDAYRVDQFAVRDNRPDLILARVGLGDARQIETYEELYKKRVRKLAQLEDKAGVALGGEKASLPETKILDAKQSGRTVELAFECSDKTEKLASYQVYVNDVPVFPPPGKSLAGKQSFAGKEKIELSAGKNKVELSAVNAKGLESLRAYRQFTNDAAPRRTLYYIGFGVSKYKKSDYNLKYAHKDALDLEAAFKKMAGGAFDKVVTKVYVDEQATVEAVKKAGELLKNAGVDDTFVLFIAGHGVHDSDKAGTYYYLTHEADVKRLAETAAPFDLVEGLLQAAPARNKFFLMDTCESGEQDEAVETAFLERAKGAGLSARTTRAITIKAREGAAEVKQTRAYLLDRDRFIFNDLFRRSGAVVFSSSRGSEFSYESDAAGNGYFTECILAALGGPADRDKNGRITAEELRSYVSAEVAKMSNDLQHPTIDRDNYMSTVEFPVVK